MQKQCTSCFVFKDLTEFFKDKGLKDGHANTCKKCKQEKTYAWRERNKDKYNAYMRQKNKEVYPEARFKRYEVTKQWYEQTLKDQNHVCAICKKSNKSKKRTFAVDHNDSTSLVRGIVCYNCNRALHAFDNLKLLEQIIKYLWDLDPIRHSQVQEIVGKTLKFDVRIPIS